MSREPYRHNMLLGPSNKPQRYGVNGTSGKHTPSEDEAKLDFSEIWLTLRQGKWIILLTCLVVTAGVATYTYLTPAEYESTTMTLIEPQQVGSTNFASVQGGVTRGLSNEVARLRYTAELYRRVAERLSELAATAENADDLSQSFPVLYDNGERRSQEDVARALRGRLAFAAMRDEDMIQITAISSSPEEAAHIANIFAEEYQVFARETSRASAAAAREYLDEMVTARRADLAEIDDEIVGFSLDRDFATRGEAGERLIAEHGNLRAQRENIRGEIDRQRYQLQALERELASLEPELGSRTVTDIEAQNLRSEIQEYSRRISEIRVQLDEFYLNNPEIRGNEDQYADTAHLMRRLEQYEERQAELVSELANVATAAGTAGGDAGGQVAYMSQLRAEKFQAETNIEGLEAQLERIEQQIANYQSELQGVPRQRVELQQLERQRRIMEQNYESFLRDFRQAIIAEESELGYVEIVNQASVPMFPVRPNMRQNVILAVLLGFGLGVGLAFLRRASNTRLETPEDLQEQGYAVTGVIPSMREEIKQSFAGKKTVEVDGHHLSTSLITLLNPWSPIAENYRLIRTNIQSADGRVPEVMLITSPEMGDGKTVTATNMAIALARNGIRTLLVDADLRRPNVHNLLGRPLGPGLGEYLRGEEGLVHMDSFRTGIDDLYFLPAGKVDVPPAEVLSSRKMTQFLQRTREQFDAVIIDSPPVLAVPDAVVLARQCTATFVVVRANSSELRALETVRSTLEAVDVPIAGTILNNFNPDKAGYAYGYGYGYGYTREYVYA